MNTHEQSLSQTGIGPSGFQAVDAHFVGTLGRVTHTTIVSLLVLASPPVKQN